MGTNGNKTHVAARQLATYIDGFQNRLLPVSTATSICDLSCRDAFGEMISFGKYQHKVILIVNIATGDDLTIKQVAQLNELSNQFGSKGLVILAFPCNQFGNKEPFSGAEVVDILRYVRPGRRFEPGFKVFEKVDVNGLHASPVWEYLRLKCPFPNDDITHLMHVEGGISWTPVSRSDVGWNYEKILINCYGQPVRRYTHRTDPMVLSKEIDEMVKRIPKAIREHQMQHRLDSRPATTSFVSSG